MRIALFAAVSLTLIGLLSGCNASRGNAAPDPAPTQAADSGGSFGDSFGRTAEERQHNWSTIMKSEWGMAADDLDVLLLAERHSRLSRWH